MTTRLPDPMAVPWPRRTPRTVLRPVTRDDATAMHSYRRLPQVCEFLSHDPLELADAERRIEDRLTDGDPTSGRIVRGLAIELEGRMVGDATLRTLHGTDGRPQLWIGYAFHPDVWGRGLATEVARELCTVGDELGLPVHADAYADNVASHRVLEKAGLAKVGATVEGDRTVILFAHPAC